MAIFTATQKNNAANGYTGAMTFAGVTTTAPGASAGTEPTGGSPAYARKAITWGSPSAGVNTATAQVFDIPSGTTIVGWQGFTAIAGTYLDGCGITSQVFSSQGTYTVTPTYTQT